MPIINKAKHPKKGEYKEQNGRTHVQEDKRTTQEGKPQLEHQVLEPPPIARSISNKERGGSPKKMPSLKELSPIAIAHFKIKTTCACYNATDTLRL
jgi:hypothetical protein